MILTIALIALFALATIATTGVLVDSALRGWNSYGALKAAANAGHTVDLHSQMVEDICIEALPQCRNSTTARIPNKHYPARIKRPRFSAVA